MHSGGRGGVLSMRWAGFRRWMSRERTVLTLKQRHYVIYYEDTVAVPEAFEVRGLSVLIRFGAGPQNALPISGYEGSFTYTLGPTMAELSARSTLPVRAGM